MLTYRKEPTPPITGKIVLEKLLLSNRNVQVESNKTFNIPSSYKTYESAWVD
jgi:hypothetical protein